jgi:N-acetylmuramoyl-L-alanine amidase
VHFNSAPNPKADGIEVFYYKSEQDKGRSASSKALAQAVLKRVLDTTKANSRGVKHGNLAVVRETKMPAILVEGGFLTNEKEAEKIKDPAYHKKLAWGIAQGVRDYLESKS